MTMNEITMMRRISTGMLLSVIIAMIFAAIVETKGWNRTRDHNHFLAVAAIHIVGAVPEEMRTTGIALYSSVFGFGSFLSALMVYLVECFTSSAHGKGNWFSDDASEARLDKYYWLLAICIFRNTIPNLALPEPETEL
ncbi:putative proton-dependent oligopeptide transporter family [Helianthus anomalus]